VGEVVRAGEVARVEEAAPVDEAMVSMDAGGVGEAVMTPPGADVAAGAAIPSLGRDGLAGVVVRRLVAAPDAAAVLRAGVLAPSAVVAAACPFHVRPVAERGEVAEQARLPDPHDRTRSPARRRRPLTPVTNSRERKK
jgi:hypothetical protein